MSTAAFYLPRPAEGRWTARSAATLHGRAVQYGEMGRVGAVASTTVLSSGVVRVTVNLTRRLNFTPDPAKLHLAEAEAEPEAPATTTESTPPADADGDGQDTDPE